MGSRRAGCDSGVVRARVRETGVMTTFTRMDQSTADQWAVIGKETVEAQPMVADHVLELLRNLDGMVLGFAVDQLTHCLQTATLAGKPSVMSGTEMRGEP